MEKFSSYRDAGTGIQPFLTPVPPGDSELLSRLTIPLRYPLGLVRTGLIAFISLLYLVWVRGVCLIFVPVPFLHDFIVHGTTYILGRSILFVLGLVWIPVEYTARKRGKSLNATPAWNPRGGDIIVSNWASWIEVVWLAIRFNPIFVLPIPELEEQEVDAGSLPQASPISYRPGRRTGTGSANIQQTRSSKPIPIAGFIKVSLWKMVTTAGNVPYTGTSSSCQTLEQIRRQARRPIVVFPECTTSNGRGLLRFANIFQKSVPVKGYNVFVMCIRYDPPTTLVPSLTHSIPSTIMNPLPHIFKLTTSLSPLPMSIRLLPLSESPSSQLFVASEVIAGTPDEDQLSEACGVLISQIGKLKRTGMGWEDKARLLELHFGRTRG